MLSPSITSNFNDIKKYKWRPPCQECVKAIPAYNAINNLAAKNLPKEMKQALTNELLQKFLEQRTAPIKVEIQIINERIKLIENKIADFNKITGRCAVLEKKLKIIQKSILPQAIEHAAKKTKIMLDHDKKKSLEIDTKQLIENEFIIPASNLDDELKILQQQLTEKETELKKIEAPIKAKAVHSISPVRTEMEWEKKARSREPEPFNFKISQNTSNQKFSIVSQQKSKQDHIKRPSDETQSESKTPSLKKRRHDSDD